MDSTTGNQEDQLRSTQAPEFEMARPLAPPDVSEADPTDNKDLPGDVDLLRLDARHKLKNITYTLGVPHLLETLRIRRTNAELEPQK